VRAAKQFFDLIRQGKLYDRTGKELSLDAQEITI